MITDNKIELRLTSVEPPEPEPKRTIYRDIVNLPSTSKLGLTIRYFNHDDVGLYFQITGSCAGYTFDTVNLNGGAVVGSGTDKYENLDDFASRAKPSVGDLPNGEMEENITLILRAFTDAGYSDLKWTFERVVTVHWINSADAAFTVDELDNFDDGTVQGWVSFDNTPNPNPPSLVTAGDYVLSPSYSCKFLGNDSYWHNDWGFIKEFTTTNLRDTIYAIINIRLGSAVGNIHFRRIKIKRGTTTLIWLGDDSATNVVISEDKVPEAQWLRIVVPLPKNSTFDLKIAIECYVSYGTHRWAAWIDNFKIISK